MRGFSSNIRRVRRAGAAESPTWHATSGADPGGDRLAFEKSSSGGPSQPNPRGREEVLIVPPSRRGSCFNPRPMGAAHGESQKHGHDDHGHHDFDSSPAKELSPGEPRSPSWLPILGACLFLVGGVYFLVGQTSASTVGSASASATPSAKVAPAPSAKAPPKPAASAPARPRPPLPRGLLSGAPGAGGPLAPPPGLARPPEAGTAAPGAPTAAPVAPRGAR